MRFVRFDRKNEAHTGEGAQCLICNKDPKDGAVVETSVGLLIYCAKCIGRLAAVMEKP